MKHLKKSSIYFNFRRVFIAGLCLITIVLMTKSSVIKADDKNPNNTPKPEQRLLSGGPTTTGLVAYYKFDEGSGTTTADSSGNSLNGQYLGNWSNTDLPDVGFANPNAISLNGTSDFVYTQPTVINDLSAGTITAWIYLNSRDQEVITSKQQNNVNSVAIFSVGLSGASSGGSDIQTPGILYFHAKNFTTNAAGVTALNTGQWYHVGVTFTSAQAKIYVNGNLDSTTNGDFSIPNLNAPTILGAWLGDGLNDGRETNYLNGRLDEVRIYDRPLSDIEMADFVTTSEFSVSKITANKGGNGGSVSVSVLGGGYQSGATVKLTAVGQPDIEGINPVVVNRSRLTATFNLQGATSGLRDVVVTLPNGQTEILPNGFTIEEGGSSQVWVDIIGRNTIRGNSQQTFTIIYGNRGNIDAPAPLLELSSPDAIKFALFNGRPFQESQLRIFAGGHDGQAGALPPGSFSLQVKVQTPAGLNQIRLNLNTIETAGQLFDWNRLANEGVPAGADSNEWQTRVTLARSRIGESTDNVMAVLREAASQSGADAHAFYDFDEFLTYTVGFYGITLEEFSGTSAATSSVSEFEMKPTAIPSTQQSSIANSVQLITIAENPNPTETFVLTHGLGGLRGFNDTRTDFFFAAAAIQQAHPNANIYIVDWTEGAKVSVPLPNGGFFPKFFTAWSNTNQAGEAAFALLRSKNVNPANTTVIGESYGNSVNGRIAQLFNEQGFGKINRALLLNPANIFGPDFFFKTDFNESVAISTNSFFDNKLKIFADHHLYLETDTLNQLAQHISGIKRLITHPELVRIFDNPLLQNNLSPFNSDGRIRLDSSYDQSPYSFLYGSLLSRDLFLFRVLLRDLLISVVNSRDPNDKVGSVGVGTPRFLSGEEPLRYSIYFENVATATAPAQEVVITDQLDITKLDLDTFSFGPISFGNNLITPPPNLSEFNQDIDLRPANDLIVRINAELNKNTGLLTWRFASIDPTTGLPTEDPLAGFLPPNVNPPEGDGSVLFTVMPKQDLVTETEIRNQAQIIFDTNAPIDTPIWLNTLDNSKPESNVHTQITTTCAGDLNVQWSGTDIGSGIRDYTIYVSDNGNPYAIWKSNTTDTSGSYHGQFGHTYTFYSVAQDKTGNIEDVPANPDATVTLTVSAQPPTITLTRQAITLWSPNHQYETVNLGQLVASASNSCGDNLTGNVVIAQVSSDEPEDAPGGGDGNTLNDIVIAADCKSVKLRAERKGNGNGRVYTITFRVTDAASNTATATAKVRVPKSQNGSPAIDDGPSYTLMGCP